MSVGEHSMSINGHKETPGLRFELLNNHTFNTLQEVA